MSQILTLLSLLPFYALGAFPTGTLIARRRGINLAEHGSGNVGATNVARVLGKKAGLITLAIDVLKGFLGVCIAQRIAPAAYYPPAAALALVCGHCFSVPGFLRGGKGVATAFGAALALSPLCGLVIAGIFAIVFGCSRIVSLASVAAALSLPISGFLLSLPNETCFGMAALAVLVVYRHKENLERLAQGTEKQFRAPS